MFTHKRRVLVHRRISTRPRMALQLLNGNSLADVLLQQQPSSRDEFVPYAHRMLGCVQMLHDLGWVCRYVCLEYCIQVAHVLTLHTGAPGHQA